MKKVSFTLHLVKNLFRQANKWNQKFYSNMPSGSYISRNISNSYDASNKIQELSSQDLFHSSFARRSLPFHTAIMCRALLFLVEITAKSLRTFHRICSLRSPVKWRVMAGSPQGAAAYPSVAAKPPYKSLALGCGLWGRAQHTFAAGNTFRCVRCAAL